MHKNGIIPVNGSALHVGMPHLGFLPELRGRPGMGYNH